jgi:hypothetical protein
MLDSVYGALGVYCNLVYAATWCMLQLGVNIGSWHGMIKMDHLTLYSAMIIEFWTRKWVVGHHDKEPIEDISGYMMSGVQLAWLGCEDLKLVVIRAGLEYNPAVSGMVNTTTHGILWSPSFSGWFPQSLLISLFLVLNSTITYKQKVMSSLSISLCHDYELTPSTTYTQYSIITWSPVSRCQHG